MDPDPAYLELARRVRNHCGSCLTVGTKVVDRGGGILLVERGKQRMIMSVHTRLEDVVPGLELQGLITRCRFGCTDQCALALAA
jgi:hypothetical protein